MKIQKILLAFGTLYFVCVPALAEDFFPIPKQLESLKIQRLVDCKSDVGINSQCTADILATCEKQYPKLSCSFNFQKIASNLFQSDLTSFQTDCSGLEVCDRLSEFKFDPSAIEHVCSIQVMADKYHADKEGSRWGFSFWESYQYSCMATKFNELRKTILSAQLN